MLRFAGSVLRRPMSPTNGGSCFGSDSGECVELGVVAGESDWELRAGGRGALVKDGIGEDAAVCFGVHVEVDGERVGGVEWAYVEEGVYLRRGAYFCEERVAVLCGLCARLRGGGGVGRLCEGWAQTDVDG